METQDKDLELPQRRTNSFSLCQEGGAGNSLVVMEVEEQKSVTEPGKSEDDRRTRGRKIPCLGIMFALACVLVSQISNVLIKKTTLNPFLFLIWRDGLRFTMQDLSLFNIYLRNPFPKGKRILVTIRGLSAGFFVAVRCYALQALPLADVSMILSMKPVFVSLLSCIFLKEPCGLFEIFNLLLAFSGIIFILQPPFIFGSVETDDIEYSSHMFYTALVLIVATAVSSLVTVILRHLRTMHWSALMSSVRLFSMVEHISVCFYLGGYCIPACGRERLNILLLSITGGLVQAFMIFSLKFEEANIVGLVDNTGNILVSVIFQAAFFVDPLGSLKLIGVGVVLSSVILLGGRKVLQHRKTVRESV